MEETAAQAMTWIQIGVLVVFAVLMLIALVIQLRERKFGPVTTVLRAAYAIAVFVALLVVSGLTVNWLWAAVFGVLGAGVGFLAGRTSKIRVADDGPMIKRSPWPALVTALAYAFAMVSALYGTADLFSVSMLVVLFAAMMTDGAALAEIMAGTSGKAASSATAAAPDQG